MEHLDLAGYLAAPINWNVGSYAEQQQQQQDDIYLSNSRPMLEPIMEETSEDEERAQNSWNQYEHSATFWSSTESETGSVIRVEVNKDLDAISERDFVCPPKRARRSDDPSGNSNAASVNSQPSSLDDCVLLRHPAKRYELETTNSLERFIAFEAAARDSLSSQSYRSSIGSRRFDDFYSDNDSYHSLSRSSSLIQFESLERQLLLQDQNVSMNSLGNSSPSLLSFDAANASDGQSGGANSGSNSGNNSRRGSQSSLMKRYESSDGRLHQTYYELNKLNFDDDDDDDHQRSGIVEASARSNMFAVCKTLPQSIECVKSDSESSTSSACSGNSILSAAKPSTEDLTDSGIGSSLFNRSTRSKASFQARAGKNSAENLSEDSGYCEPSTLRRVKSKSIPKNFDKFCEEEEEFQYTIENCSIEAAAPAAHSKNNTTNSNRKANNENLDMCDANDLCQTKIANAAYLLESCVDVCAPSLGINSALRAQELQELQQQQKEGEEQKQQEQQQQEHEQQTHDDRDDDDDEEVVRRRSMAHSPSPVSSDISTGSSCCSMRSTYSSASASAKSNSTCASAASFTWLPTTATATTATTKTTAAATTKHQINQEEKATHREQIHRRVAPDDFSVMLRSSLPDIREAYGSENSFINCSYPIQNSITSNCKTFGCEVSRKSVNNGNGLEPLKSSQDISKCVDISPANSDATTDTESTPETARKGVANTSNTRGGVSQRGRISSVPNELNKIGRKKRSAVRQKYNKSSIEGETSSYSSGDEDSERNNHHFDFDNCQIRRSGSWSEHRVPHFESFNDPLRPEYSQPQSQALGYMNASYQNLTLLDYSGRKSYPARAETNQKRCQNLEMDAKKRASTDFDGLICKGNFLLDELSEIYDKNASILNDKPLQEIVEEEHSDKSHETDFDEEVCTKVQKIRKVEKPAVPPRHKRSSNSDLSVGESCESEIQHIQLTIRNPPVQLNRNAESNISFGTFGKTFDQDPTNLRTSYAQSLEKCNFDAKEISTTDVRTARAIPKRRFQSQATATKKRNMVSSTPNLNAYDPRSDDLEDDMYVCSAHTSMNQLSQSQGQKPLGILLPAGSRTSFGKEVSFCPVVSKYSWQEQSSEECYEPEPPIAEDEIIAALDDVQWDDEVLHNTKENENIAARFNVEPISIREPEANEERPSEIVHSNTLKKEQQLQNIEYDTETLFRFSELDRESLTTDDQTSRAVKPVSGDNELKTFCEQLSEVSCERTIASEVTKVEVVRVPEIEIVIASSEIESDSVKADIETKLKHESLSIEPIAPATNTTIATTTTTPNIVTNNKTQSDRPLSLHLPILSEPPINRAHHILYASQQLLDRYQEPARSNAGSNSAIMSNNYAIRCSENENMASGIANNNNSENMKTKFKADEKHPSSKGFLTRFANGFRFSLRRKKKQQQQQQQQQLEQQKQTKESKVDKKSINGVPQKSAAVSKQNSPDFIYIPLKGPLPGASRAIGGNYASDATANLNDSNASTASTVSVQSQQETADGTNGIGVGVGDGRQVSKTSTLQKLVTGKPPLPKQPPRSLQSTGIIEHAHSRFYPNTLGNDDLDSVANYYTSAGQMSQYDDFANQLNSGKRQQQLNNGIYAGTVMNPSTVLYASPSRATVSQKTQMFNQMCMQPNAQIVTAVPVAVTAYKTTGNANNTSAKIGLIETNLDTHETSISGKTRSLIDIAGPQHKRYIVKRLNVTSANYDRDNNDLDNDIDIGIGCVNNDNVVIKTTSQGAGAQIASIRRPHKSMEFLLDKENQKNALPPENELQKSHDHNPAALSEHQLRVQASLQRLNIPDWFRAYNQGTARSPEGGNVAGSAGTASGSSYKPGNFTRKRTQDSGRWAGLNSKTTSLSSLGSQRSDRSPLLLSPSAHSHHGGQGGHASGGGGGVGGSTHYNMGAGSSSVGASSTGAGSFSRWSTSHLNSSQTSPSVSQRGSFARGAPINSSFISVASGNSGVLRNSYRQPYLGWRSQEKLSQRTPHERLASSLLAQQQRNATTTTTAATITATNGLQQIQPVTPEIQSSIKEVTSAIVHYVNDQTQAQQQQQQQQRSRSTSPNSR